MKSAPALAWVAALGMVVAGCGGARPRSRTARAAPIAPAPVAPCSLLSARQASAVLGVRARMQGSAYSCTYEGTRHGVFRSVVVTPQRLTAVPLAAFDPSEGRIVQLTGAGYRGEAQNDPSTAAGLAQSKAQLVAGGIVVRVFVTYKSGALLGQPQRQEAVTLAGDVGRHLAAAK